MTAQEDRNLLQIGIKRLMNDKTNSDDLANELASIVSDASLSSGMPSETWAAIAEALSYEFGVAAQAAREDMA